MIRLQSSNLNLDIFRLRTQAIRFVSSNNSKEKIKVSSSNNENDEKSNDKVDKEKQE